MLSRSRIVPGVVLIGTRGLPGDSVIERGNFRVTIPVTSSVRARRVLAVFFALF
jgi:hypothetical protein